jgi:hypothetical protein
MVSKLPTSFVIKIIIIVKLFSLLIKFMNLEYQETFFDFNLKKIPNFLKSHKNLFNKIVINDALIKSLLIENKEIVNIMVLAESKKLFSSLNFEKTDSNLVYKKFKYTIEDIEKMLNKSEDEISLLSRQVWILLIEESLNISFIEIQNFHTIIYYKILQKCSNELKNFTRNYWAVYWAFKYYVETLTKELKITVYKPYFLIYNFRNIFEKTTFVFGEKFAFNKK